MTIPSHHDASNKIDPIAVAIASTIHAAGPDGATMGDLMAATGSSRDTVERRLRELGVSGMRMGGGALRYLPAEMLDEEDSLVPMPASPDTFAREYAQRAFRAWADWAGFAPSSHDWERDRHPSESPRPTYNTVRRLFGSWRAFLASMGEVAPTDTSERRHLRRELRRGAPVGPAKPLAHAQGRTLPQSFPHAPNPLHSGEFSPEATAIIAHIDAMEARNAARLDAMEAALLTALRLTREDTRALWPTAVLPESLTDQLRVLYGRPAKDPSSEG